MIARIDTADFQIVGIWVWIHIFYTAYNDTIYIVSRKAVHAASDFENQSKNLT